jgi:CopA family copper-resistance protein
MCDVKFRSTALFSVFSVLLLFSQQVEAKVVKHELVVTQKVMNMSGKKDVDFALVVNGTIPAPTLEFTEGDDVEIKVVNNIPTGEEVSIHWHGILLPPEEDGVAYVNTPPIFKGQSRTFKFKLRQHGTYWYHSHTMLQEQKGVFGAFIVYPKKKEISYDKDVVVVLSDWSDENGDQILKNLRKDGDYYLYKKDSMRSYWGAVKAKSLGTYLANELDRMGGMDLSDVGYDAFLINGKKDSQLDNAKPGEKIRIRVINAGASSYFYVSLGNMPMQVISADGIDIEPILAKEILVGMAETYDILFTVPDNKNYELRATVQDVTGFASGWIGGAQGQKVSAETKPLPDYYAPMSHGDHADHSQHQAATVDPHAGHAGHKAAEPAAKDPHAGHKMDAGHDHSKVQAGKGANSVIPTLSVDHLKSEGMTAFPSTTPVHDVKLVLGGDMERYIWHINGNAIHEDRNIIIKEGDVVRFTFQNDTMMHHPMHLHGHFFRVINASGDHSPLKHTVDVPPHGTRTIEFLANEPGEWMLHCHNLFHMKTGMARVVKYSSFKPSAAVAAIQKDDPHLHDHIYFDGELMFSTEATSLDLRLSKTWDTLELDLKSGEYEDFEKGSAELIYRRWRSNFLNIMLGAEHDFAEEEDPTRPYFGVGYLLPLLIESDLAVDTNGGVSLALEKKFQWTKYFYTDLEAEVYFHHDEPFDPEIEANLFYASRWDWAGGLVFHEDGVEAAVRYRF